MTQMIKHNNILYDYEDIEELLKLRVRVKELEVENQRLASSELDGAATATRYRKALIGIVEGYRFGRFPDAIRMADEALLPDIECPVCRARLGLGVAITQKRTLGCMSYTISDTKISRCLKCPQCGHSETIEG